jgi:hypothetical protein
MKTADDEIDDVVETIEVEPDANEPEAETAEGDEADGDGDDEVIISIGEESPPQEEETRAPEWVRELRKSNREKERKIRELEAKLNATVPETKPVALGKKPTLEDYDYDTEEFEKQLEVWYERKREADAAQAEAEAAQEAEAKAWQDKLASYEKAKVSLKVRDYEDAEAVALDTFNITQQGIVLQGSDNPALLIYALGKDSKRAKELASINDPVKFAFAVAKLETQLKVSNRKAASSPERTITNAGGRISGAVDSTLERLRAEALKTGNLSKVMEYKRRNRG